MRAIVVRHYKTLINASDRIMGWGDAPRVKDWEQDLAWVSQRLRELEVPIDSVYSSALERARQTAMYYAKQRGIWLIHDAAALNEVNYPEKTATFRYDDTVEDENCYPYVKVVLDPFSTLDTGTLKGRFYYEHKSKEWDEFLDYYETNDPTY